MIVGVKEGVWDGVTVNVCEGVTVAVFVGVDEGVCEGVSVNVSEGVTVAVGVSVAVLDGVNVGEAV